MNSEPVIGYWMSERKSQKLNWNEFEHVCRKNGYELKKIDLDRKLEDQGPFTVMLHKLTEFIARNDQQSLQLIQSWEKYLSTHLEIALIDPFDSVRLLLDRYMSYRVVERSGLSKIDVFTPSYVELSSSDVQENIKKIRSSGVGFPFISKPHAVDGTTDCHKMAIIFNEDGVKNCKVPCVAQKFINHNAVLFKIFIVGDEYQVVERPSIKNFYSYDGPTIFFNTHKVSKSDSTSKLTILDPEDGECTSVIDDEKLQVIVKVLQKELNMSLFGVDIVVEKDTGRHAIIDINVYPGYDGFPNFFDSLMRCIKKKAEERQAYINELKNKNGYNLNEVKHADQDDSGFDTCDSSDERKNNAYPFGQYKKCQNIFKTNVEGKV